MMYLESLKVEKGLSAKKNKAFVTCGLQIIS